MESELSVREFYKDRSVLVTGGSGFMGKVLVEKLLRGAPRTGRVFLLLRPKRGKSVRQRLDDLLRSPVFDRIKNEQNEALTKIIPVEGDVLSENLGISPSELDRLAAEVSVVFHLAATVHMNAPLKYCVDMNVAGTQRALDVARSFNNLAIFVHVSTAFCYPDYEILEEKIHSAVAAAGDVVRLCEWLDEPALARLEPALLAAQAHPNTYTYTKRLAESVVQDAHPRVPCVIARPSVVCPALREPLPGWVDNLQGPVGLLAGGGKGVIRTMLCDGRLHAQFIPVDLAINALLAMAVIEASKETRCDNVPIYNVNVGDKNPLTWGELVAIAKSHGKKYPLAWPLWYPDAELTTSRALHHAKRLLFHLLPAYLIDFLLLIAGQRRFMVRVQEKISHGLELLQYFTMREWAFPCPNYDAIHTILSKEENEVFVTYKDDIDKEEFIVQGIETARVHVLGEDPADMPRNRAYHTLLFAVDWVVKLVFWWCVVSAAAGRWPALRRALAPAPAPAPALPSLPLLGRALPDDTADVAVHTA